jgi:hypothetical protein
MPVTRDIAATYRGPGKVMRRLLDMGPREDRALVLVLIASVLTFVAFAPYQARLAHSDTTVPLMARLYWSGFFWVFLWPLILYVVAGLVFLLARLAGQRLSGFGVRMTLFWAYLASIPLILLVGMTAGFIGSGPQLQLLGFIWVVVFFWFWISGLIAASKS